VLTDETIVVMLQQNP